MKADSATPPPQALKHVQPRKEHCDHPSQPSTTVAAISHRSVAIATGQDTLRLATRHYDAVKQQH
jgi:hypothetical protein